jgi:hypothetical protein
MLSIHRSVPPATRHVQPIVCVCVCVCFVEPSRDGGGLCSPHELFFVFTFISIPPPYQAIGLRRAVIS